MQELKIFKNEKFGEVRIEVVNGKELFCASDVARALGYKRPNDATTQHCKGTVKHRIATKQGNSSIMNFIPELGYKNPRKAISDHCKGVTKCDILTNGGKQSKKYINEDHLYRLTTRSKIEGAEEFESWIFDEILPMIRRTGAYILDNVWDQITNDPTKFGEILIDYGRTKDELKQVKAKNDILMHTEKTYTVTEIAKELGVSSARILNQILFK